MAKQGFFRSLTHKTFFEQSRFAAEKRQKLNLKIILTLFGSLLGVVMLGIVIFTPSDDVRPTQPPPKLEYTSGVSLPKDISPPELPRNNTQRFTSTSQGATSSGAGSASGRSRNANQVIRRGMNGNDPGALVPMGSVIRARLMNSVLSTNTVSPVVALTLQEAQSQDGLSIPQGTKVLGSATYDDQSKRIQIQFQNLIYEDGSQHALQAMAVMPDGSAGLSGEYHSGEGKRQLGQFFGNFIGGLADGMKDRSSSGGFYGGSIEPGSIKNGLLNGVSISASDEAKTIANEMGSEKPSMSIQAGFQFQLFLQKEYVP